jgi:DNA mismatch repair protein MutS2
MRKKLDKALSKYLSYLQESIVSTRGGRYVLPVKKNIAIKLAVPRWMRRQAFRLYLLSRLVSLDLHVKHLHLQAEEETTVVSDLKLYPYESEYCYSPTGRRDNINIYLILISKFSN